MKRSLVALSLALVASATSAQSAEVDLLQTVPAQVVVSSAISPGLSGPSRMIDGRDDTAWCSRTGDLVGAWVLVQIPSDASVSEIRLTPGYVRNDHGIDAWTRNHRITRVAISRDGALLGEHDLDPARAEPQAIPVSGGGGLYRIEVRATVAGTVRSYGEACITTLEVRGRPGAAHGTAEARVATLRGDGAHAAIAARGAARTTSFAQAETYGGIAMGDVAEDEAAFVPLVQQTHVSRVRVHRIVTRGPARGDRVLYAYYYLSPYEESRMEARMARRARGSFQQEGCEHEEGADDCPSLRLARISVPARGVPTVDGDIELGTDVCSDELHTLVRDLDADDLDELRVSASWETHPVCPVGTASHSSERILDERTLREEFASEPRMHEAGSCGFEITEIRRALDLNADGHPDFEVRQTNRLDCESYETEEATPEERALTRPRTVTTRWLYDAMSDAWHEDPPPPAAAP